MRGYKTSKVAKLSSSFHSSQFLADTFNALFAIMEEMAAEVGDLVFEALVSVCVCVCVTDVCVSQCMIFLTVSTPVSPGVHYWTVGC